MNDTEYVVM